MSGVAPATVVLIVASIFACGPQADIGTRSITSLARSRNDPSASLTTQSASARPLSDERHHVPQRR